MGLKEYIARKKAERAEFNRVKQETKQEAIKERNAAYKAERYRAARESGRKAAVPLSQRIMTAAKPAAQKAIRYAQGPPQRAERRPSGGSSESFGGIFGGSSGESSGFVPFGGYGAGNVKKRKKGRASGGMGMFGGNI